VFHTAIPLALVVVLYDVFLIIRSEGRATSEKSHFFQQVAQRLATILQRALWSNALFVCIGVLNAYFTLSAAKSGQQMDKEWNEMHHLNTWQRILRSNYAVGFYVSKSFWPHSLSVRYMVPLPEFITFWHIEFGASTLITAVISFSVLSTQLKMIAGSKIDSLWSVLGFCWASYLVLLLPTLGMFSDHVQTLAADRYCYIPAMLIGVPLLSRVLQTAHRRSALLLRVTFVAAVSILIYRTRLQVASWSTNLSMWHKTTEVNPSDHLAHFNLAVSYQAEERLYDAVDNYKHAVRIKPNYAVAYKNMAQAMNKDQKHTEAVEQCKQAVAILPHYFEGYLELGNSLNQAGDSTAAGRAFQKAVKISPTHSGAIANLAVALHSSGLVDEAIEVYQQALRLTPSLGAAQSNLQIALRDRDKRR
jgi:tetratricopeptide (TPR) repeat protein